MRNQRRHQRLRILTLVLCGTLVAAGLPLLSCAGTGSGETATDTATGTAPETAPATDTATDTETSSETATESPEEAARRKQEQMDALYAATVSRLLPIGGWGTPAPALREVYSNTPGSYDKAWQLLADAHLNFMVSLEEWSSPLWTMDSASSAHKAGMKLWYNCSALDAGGALERINSVLNSEYADVLDTVYLKDEPAYGDFAELKKLYDSIRAGLGDREMTYFANLLPTYAPGNLIANDYRTYVRDYIATVKPEVLTEEEKKAWIATQSGVTCGSDAFFPFGDNVERARKSGVQYIAEPGGSIRDDHVIETANKYGMTMCFTGMRLFHH